MPLSEGSGNGPTRRKKEASSAPISPDSKASSLMKRITPFETGSRSFNADTAGRFFYQSVKRKAGRSTDCSLRPFDRLFNTKKAGKPGRIIVCRVKRMKPPRRRTRDRKRRAGRRAHCFSNSFATSASSFRIGRCCGHAFSHLPQPTHSDALPPCFVWTTL